MTKEDVEIYLLSTGKVKFVQSPVVVDVHTLHFPSDVPKICIKYMSTNTYQLYEDDFFERLDQILDKFERIWYYQGSFVEVSSICSSGKKNYIIRLCGLTLENMIETIIQNSANQYEY